MRPRSKRFLALDVFRGLTIAFMIIVNSPGTWESVYDPLEHAAWHGFTPADLVFPSFLFAVGAAMSYSLESFRGKSNLSATLKILKRSALLFLLGFLMYWYPFFRLTESFEVYAFPFSETRILGVLQRIALCYGLVALSLWYLGEKISYVLGCLILLSYWGILALAGVDGDPFSITGNAVLHLDLILFGASHLYQGEGIPFDPEGLLSTLPAVCNVLAGFAMAQYIRVKGTVFGTVLKFMLAGLILISVAYFWDQAFPINKKLWTSSFVLVAIGWDLLIVGILLWVLPARSSNNQSLSFFETLGKNPLAVYLLSELLLITFYLIPVDGTRLWPYLFDHVFSPAGLHAGSLLMAISFTLLCWCVGYALDKKGWYWRV